MSGMDRLFVVILVLALGKAVGYLIRRRLHAAEPANDRSFALPNGLVIITAPYCTRCASLRSRLANAGIGFATVDAAHHPSLLADLGISSAPTLLQVDTSGRIIDREHRDFSDARLATLAQPTTERHLRRPPDRELR